MGKTETPNTTEAALGVTRQGVPIVPQFGYPSKLDSVAAEVLARLLQGESLQSLEMVYCSSTTRLAAQIHYIERAYLWDIERRELVAGCADGRIAWVTQYSLHGDVIAAAMADGAAEWVADVFAARRVLRAKAADAMRAAAGINATSGDRKRKCQSPDWGAY